jgi:hypothetical protein
MGRDRGNEAARKGKGKEKEVSSSQSKSSPVVGVMMSTLNKLSTSFIKAQLWK